MSDLISALGGIAANGLTGGILGLLGTGAQLWFKAADDKRRHKHEQAMREFDLKAIELEHRLKLEEVKVVTEGERAIAAEERAAEEAKAGAAIQTASYEVDKASYGIGFVDALRGLMRPIITVYLLVAMSVIAYNLYLAVRIPEGLESWRLFQDVVEEGIFLTTMCVTWWFGGRIMARRGGA